MGVQELKKDIGPRNKGRALLGLEKETEPVWFK